MPVEPTTLAAFSLAAIAVYLAPGVDIAFIASRGINHGRRAGVVAGMGIALGVAIQAAASALGVTALFLASPILFEIIRWTGVAYLCWLGLSVLRGGDERPEVARERSWSVAGTMSKGAGINLLNPKVALFFLAFLPQFVDPARGDVTVQLAFLGGFFAAGSVVWCGALGLVFGSLGARFSGSDLFRRWQRRVTGTAFIGFAAALGFADVRR